jgi:hypothetical protein
LKSYAKDTCKGLDSAFKKAPPLKRPVIVGRACEIRPDNFKVGKKFQDLGFLSTTVNADTIDSFRGKYGVVLRIKVPEGAKVLCGYYGDNPGEEEIILNRGSSFKITSVKKVTGQRNTHHKTDYTIVDCTLNLK